MATEGNLISFDELEPHKENIQPVASGRSAKLLARQLSPLTSGYSKPATVLDPVNEGIRDEFESEIQSLDESDDPLDVYDRYVKWTIEAFPGVQNTPSSSLVPLLERATKTFLGYDEYRNDARYLRLWLMYFDICRDMSPNETYQYIAGNGIGTKLALFYEEYAAFLERQGAWKQAEEVYAVGLEKDAKPKARLERKHNEFCARHEAHIANGGADKSTETPPLRAARPALGIVRHEDADARNPQEAYQPLGEGRTKNGPKLQVFEDDSEQSVLASGEGGWQSIQSFEARRKENKRHVEQWQGQKMRMERQDAGVPKMMVYEDPKARKQLSSRPRAVIKLPHPLPEKQKMFNPKTGRIDYVFVKLDAVYPDPTNPEIALSFEELRARHRGWVTRGARVNQMVPAGPKSPLCEISPRKQASMDNALTKTTNVHPQTLPLNDVPESAEQAEARRRRRERKEAKKNRTRKIELKEVRAPDRTVQLNLQSPSGQKVKRKRSGDATATMTINTKEAMDEVYDLFNQTLNFDNPQAEEEDESSEASDDDYTSAGESTGTHTGRISGTNSEYGDETRNEIFNAKGEPTGGTSAEAKEAEAWSDFTGAQDGTEASETGEITDRSDPTRFEVFQDPTVNTSDRSEESGEVATPTEDAHPESQQSPHTTYLPEPLEDFAMPPNPYRHPDIVAQSRLPFMTPIVEKTETSLGLATARAEKDYFNAKTPSRKTGEAKTPLIIARVDDEPYSSPFQEVLIETKVERIVLAPVLTGSKPKNTETKAESTTAVVARPRAPLTLKEDKPSGPIIKDTQCNPVDEHIRATILANISPPLASYTGYHEEPEVDFGRCQELRRFTRAAAKSKAAGEKNGTAAPVLALPGLDRTYTVKRELGQGAFAPVYLVEGANATEKDGADDNEVARMGHGAFSTRGACEALKTEFPPSPWEFYIIQQCHRRLGVSRAAESIIRAHEMYLFRDEGYLILDFKDQGTLLDMINLGKDASCGLNPLYPSSCVMDESLAMWVTIELMRTVESLHKAGIVHGDLKADNVMMRLDTGELSNSYYANGSNGWSSKGVALIDMGRGIDMRAFPKEVQFIADWKVCEQDCIEMRELRPWTYQIDYHGLAGVIHSLLFGKYIDTVADRNNAVLGQGSTKKYKIRESLKRYWQTEIWGEVFDLLLNPLSRLEGEEGQRMPVLKGMKAVRERMESWLMSNAEKGVGLATLVRKIEMAVKERRR